jgi:hypothetical protein
MNFYSDDEVVLFMTPYYAGIADTFPTPKIR